MDICTCCKLTTWNVENSEIISSKQNIRRNYQYTLKPIPFIHGSLLENEAKIATTIYPVFYFKIVKCRKAGIMLLHKNRVLIVQSRNNKWSFPKGEVEADESILECAIRETKEETSITVDIKHNDCLLQKFNNTALFLKELQSKPTISVDYIKANGKDCTGIGWIRVSCLKKTVLQGKKSLFNTTLAKFTKHYF